MFEVVRAALCINIAATSVFVDPVVDALSCIVMDVVLVQVTTFQGYSW